MRVVLSVKSSFTQISYEIYKETVCRISTVDLKPTCQKQMEPSFACYSRTLVSRFRINDYAFPKGWTKHSCAFVCINFTNGSMG